MIIHTVSFRIVLSYEDNLVLRQKVRNFETMFVPRFKNGKFVHYSANYKNLRFIFNPDKYKQHLIIECEVDKIFGEAQVLEEDLNKFEKVFSKIVQEFLEMNFPIIILKYPLFRIDYKYDFRLQNDQEVNIFFEIISKVKDRYCNLKRISPNDKDKSSLYFRPEGKTDPKGRKHFKRGKMNLNAYYRYLKSHREEDKYLIRLEVQVFSKEINQEFKKNGTCKDLANYWNEATYKEYIGNYKKVLYTQDYYRIDIALKKIKELHGMRPTTKKRICRLLELINKFGETQGRKKFSKEYNQSSFYRDMATLKKLGINPITFGDIQKNTFPEIECLKNFLKKNKDLSMD